MGRDQLSFLVVDDSRLHHQIYNLVLSNPPYQGSQVLHAMDGLEGYNLLKANPDVNIVLLDIKMPVMDGVAFMRRRKEEGVALDVPVVLVTTEGDTELRAEAMSLGAADYLHKPFVPQELHRVLAQLLKR